jgi:hypothetical protein
MRDRSPYIDHVLHISLMKHIPLPPNNNNNTKQNPKIKNKNE